jgi:hypothetical protein
MKEDAQTVGRRSTRKAKENLFTGPTRHALEQKRLKLLQVKKWSRFLFGHILVDGAVR